MYLYLLSACGCVQLCVSLPVQMWRGDQSNIYCYKNTILKCGCCVPGRNHTQLFYRQGIIRILFTSNSLYILCSSEPIASTTAEEENQAEGIPSIKVEPAEGVNNIPAKKKRPFTSSSPKLSKKAKPVSEIPDQGIQKKGYVYRKKGAFGAWEKTYCVLTFAAMYFTSGEEVKEYNHMFVLGVDGSPSVKQEKKGHDKQSQSVVVKYGRNKEVISVPSSDVASWKEMLEGVLGLGSCELPSEEEEEEEEDGKQETTSAVVDPIQDGESMAVAYYTVVLGMSMAVWENVCMYGTGNEHGWGECMYVWYWE